MLSAVRCTDVQQSIINWSSYVYPNDNKERSKTKRMTVISENSSKNFESKLFNEQFWRCVKLAEIHPHAKRFVETPRYKLESNSVEFHRWTSNKILFLEIS